MSILGPQWPGPLRAVGGRPAAWEDDGGVLCLLRHTGSRGFRGLLPPLEVQLPVVHCDSRHRGGALLLGERGRDGHRSPRVPASAHTHTPPGTGSDAGRGAWLCPVDRLTVVGREGHSPEAGLGSCGRSPLQRSTRVRQPQGPAVVSWGFGGPWAPRKVPDPLASPPAPRALLGPELSEPQGPVGSWASCAAQPSGPPPAAMGPTGCTVSGPCTSPHTSEGGRRGPLARRHPRGHVTVAVTSGARRLEELSALAEVQPG